MNPAPERTGPSSYVSRGTGSRKWKCPSAYLFVLLFVFLLSNTTNGVSGKHMAYASSSSPSDASCSSSGNKNNSSLNPRRRASLPLQSTTKTPSSPFRHLFVPSSTPSETEYVMESDAARGTGLWMSHLHQPKQQQQKMQLDTNSSSLLSKRFGWLMALTAMALAAVTGLSGGSGGAATAMAMGGIAESFASVAQRTILSVPFWSALAPFASICLKLSPMPTVLRIRQQKSTGNLPLLPYSAMCTMTFVLVVYGYLIGDSKVMLTHGCGHLLSLFYCLNFGRIYYLEIMTVAGNHQVKRKPNLPGSIDLHLKTGLSIAVSLLATIAVLGKERAAPIAGMTSVVLSCLMSIGPLAALKHAIQTKTACFPVPFAVASSVNAVAWFVYGYFGIHNFMIWAPCAIGFSSATAQLVLNGLYNSNSK